MTYTHTETVMADFKLQSKERLQCFGLRNLLKIWRFLNKTKTIILVTRNGDYRGTDYK